MTDAYPMVLCSLANPIWPDSPLGIFTVLNSSHNLTICCYFLAKRRMQEIQPPGQAGSQ
jgi:hypothetical protein